MEDHSSETLNSVPVFENYIGHLQMKVQSEIEELGKDVTEATFLQTFNLCDIVKDQILNYEDESQLSKTQNALRKVSVASELFVGICSVHDHYVDFVFTKIIHDLLQLEMYKVMSSRISHKICLKLKKEKFFAREARAKLLESLKEDNLEGEEETRRKEPEEPEQEKEVEDNIQEEIPLPEIGDSFIEDSFRDDGQFNQVGYMTQARIEPLVEQSVLQLPTTNIPQDISLLPTEISIREPFFPSPVEEELNQILQIHDEIHPVDVGKSGLPENLLEPVGNIEEPPLEKQPSPVGSIEKEDHAEEVSDWSLSTLQPVETTKKKHVGVIIDKLTTIPNYSARALHLNNIISIQRVQIFEGPPRILQAMSPEYLMKTPSRTRFLSQNVRSSVTSKLYERNLTTERRPVEPFIMPEYRKRTTDVQERNVNISMLPMREGIVEEVGRRIGLRSAIEKSDVLTEIITERHPPIPGVLERENLISVPAPERVSVIDPPEIDKTNALAIPSPRIQQLQGTTLESRKDSPPWFFSTEEKPPRAEFREFNTVRRKLQNYWCLFEMQGMEKSVTLHEFLSFEENGNIADYITLLRIVDKLSIKRELFLEFKNGDVLIKPFEIPYVSKDQFLLQGKEQIF